MSTKPPTGQSPEADTAEKPSETASIQIAELTTKTTTTETTALTAADISGRRQVFRDIRRQLEEGDLASKGVQKLLLNELEMSQGECEELKAYVERYHDADKRAAVLEERLTTDKGAEIMFAVGLTLGGALIGWAPTLWDGTAKGPIALVIGILLVAGSGIAKATRQ